MAKKITVLLFALMIGLTLIGCDSVLNNDGYGELALSIADAPVNNARHVYVTLDKVEVYNVENGWMTVNDFTDQPGGELTVDLLTLRFNEQLLGQEELPAGTYNAIRLLVAAKEEYQNAQDRGKSYVVYEDENGTLVEEDIFIPSGTQTGLKINKDSGFEGFTIEEGTITQLVLDNDVSKLLNQAGKSGLIILRPTAIRVINKVVSGDIVGQVLDENNQVITDVDVIITALDSNGNEVASTVATIEEMDNKPAGSFKLRGLPEGTYTVEITAEGYNPQTINNVEVIAKEENDLGLINITASTTN